MATEALRYYSARVAELDPELRPTSGPVYAFATTRFQTISSPQQSKELTASRKHRRRHGPQHARIDVDRSGPHQQPRRRIQRLEFCMVTRPRHVTPPPELAADIRAP
jgi:hypothetical protein